MTKYVDFDIEEKLAELTMGEKISLLGGRDFWHTVDIPAKGIPPVRMSDGPNGVRGGQFYNGTPASCLPCGTGLASAFDVSFAERVGKFMGQECRLKGAHIILGPTINIQRSPLGGRGFESYSEDPYLSGRVASAYVNGVQSQGVSATMKHFVGNEQEFERFSNDSVIPIRALRELYLEAFRVTQKHSDPWCYMSSYNSVNGTHVSENKQLLDDILRKEWGYNGLVMSDWTGVYSCKESILAGLDVEMPGPPVFRGAQVQRQVTAGKIFEWQIDDRVRNVLQLAKRAIASGIPFNMPEEFADTPEIRAFLREAAANAVVLLKNEKNLLPIAPSTKKIAVIGANARVAQTSGGGSAALQSSYTVTPLEGITNAAKEIGAEVTYEIGSASYLYLPPITPLCSLPGGQGKGQEVALAEFWMGAPPKNWLEDLNTFAEVKTEVTHSSNSTTMNALFMDGLPIEILKGDPYIRMTTIFTPDYSGAWEFALSSAGETTLFVNGKQVIENAASWAGGELMFGLGSQERRAIVKDLVAGQPVEVEVRSQQRIDLRGSPFKVCGAIRVGALPVVDEKEAIAKAVAAAKAADVAVVVVGLNSDYETEGYDRKNMKLPGTSDRLVSAILAANPNTVIVNQTGTPVEMPWISEAPTLLQAFYGGNDLGNGLADVLFGKKNPSSKLPLSFPKRIEDSPSHLCFGITSDTPGKTLYNESIYVGYKHFDKSNLEPLFPFGHGLSYTTFSYSDLSVSSISDEGKFSVSVSVTNTGKVEGSEVVQVYVSNPTSTQSTPVKEFKGFEKITLAPGKSQKVTIELDRDALKYFDERRNWWIAEAKEYVVSVGGSSAVLPLSAKTTLGKQMTWLGI